MAHVAGQSRYQSTLFPEVLDEIIAVDCQVRVVDAFVDTLELGEAGFSKVEAEETGRPPYDPGDLLKLYIYGYLNRVRSSRRLAAEAARNVEVMWLINRLMPSFKTIADFRKDHAGAIVRVCRAFIEFCREQAQFGAELLAIDGTKIAAVASAALKAQRAKLESQARELAALGRKQMVATEIEAKLMRTPHGHQVAYNAQTVVDAKHKLIVAFDLTNEGNDQQQLHPMAAAGKAALRVDEVTVVADTGYSNGEQGACCEQEGITAIVPRAETVNPKGKQYFSRDRFVYDRDRDCWRCPAGATLSLYKTSHTQKKKEYTSTSCAGCPLKPQCTSAARRVIVRDFYEDAREAMHRRATGDPIWMKYRREMAEHPFGTMKWLMGYPRFLVRGLIKAKAELALGVLSYNLKRVINILGVPALLQALHLRPA